MRARKTAKYLKAIEKAAELKLRVSLHERELIYSALESAGYFWSSDKKSWAQDNAGRSVFEAPDGSPLPHARVRVTSHYEIAIVYGRIIADALRAVGIKVEVVTEEPEINDKGAGARVYLHIYTETIPQGEYTTI